MRPKIILPRQAPNILINPSPAPIDADWIVKSPSIANTNTLGSWINPYPNDDVPIYALELRPYER